MIFDIITNLFLFILSSVILSNIITIVMRRKLMILQITFVCTLNIAIAYMAWYISNFFIANSFIPLFSFLLSLIIYKSVFKESWADAFINWITSVFVILFTGVALSSHGYISMSFVNVLL